MAYKILKNDIKPYAWGIVLVIVLGIISGLTKSAPAIFIKQLVAVWDTEPFDKTKALQIPLIIFIALMTSNFARYFLVTNMRLISEKICLNLRLRLLDKYLYSSLDLLNQETSGRGGLMSRMLQDIGIIQAGYGKVADIIKEPVVFIATLAYIFYLNPYLSSILVISMPFVFWVLSRFVKSLKKHSTKNLEFLGVLAQTLKESLDGSKIIRSFNLEKKMRKTFSDQIDEYFRTKKKIIQREELSGPISEVLITFSFATVLILIGQQISNKTMDMADFTAYIFAVGFCTDSGKKLQEAFMRIQQSIVARVRLEDILLQADAIKDPENPKAFPQDWDYIHFDNVSYKVGENEILKGINLKIKRGEQIALVGHSGSGKTTIINLLERFLDPTSGHIRIGSVDVKDIKISELRDNIALVSQDVFLFDDSIKENILSGNQNIKATEEQMLNASTSANAHKFISAFPEKYLTKVGDSGARLSGGEKQRISIARAILKNSPILLLDEATSALDNHSEAEVQKSLNQMMEGRTSIVIAHRLSTIQNVDVIYVMDRGQIVDSGNHQELSHKAGLYQSFLTISDSNRR